ncbi:hypothetical protein Daesc_007601 [Daldinia eschscholtzii]|uniref:SRR1-like domain-containing protein n=1 Tax=Daldinia eschscholtzii TaxID=292717 RepID=A0AAX6MFY1_9PEZI
MAGKQNQKDDAEVEVVSNGIVEMYNRGTRLFTKDTIRHIAEQLEKYRDNKLENNKLHFTNMKGEDVEVILDPSKPPVWEDMNTVDPQKACLAIGVTWPGPHPVLHHHRLPSIDETLSNTFSRAELGQVFDHVRQQWEASEQYVRLKKLLKSRKAQLANVKKIVAVALGTLANGSKVSRPSIVQHALTLSLQQMLSKMKTPDNRIVGIFQSIRDSVLRNKIVKTPIPCFAQDPAYLPRDKAVLAELGITFLEDPWAFLEVDDTSLVVSVDPNIPVRQIIADIARPVAIIQHKMMEMNGPDASAW